MRSVFCLSASSVIGLSNVRRVRPSSSGETRKLTDVPGSRGSSQLAMLDLHRVDSAFGLTLLAVRSPAGGPDEEGAEIVTLHARIETVDPRGTVEPETHETREVGP